ncbi:MAG: 3'-5' exonuclease [Drouetiella hepatica Uher 2000/2452]|jgi:DNA polymerase-3 subunit epsilon|uniref:3'-5' exonuclease n=1 Tax=Drouetiella hepatica Uher 2000/2452 TaxID=904376 RepID=A0A951QAY8_9CYAN|nr:3'-5' exonuclease [Drouetiella hepatica Uher 2000/2452]
MLSSELLRYYRWVSQQPLAIVDVETTGRYATTSRLTEISVIRATLAEGVLEQQTSLINPQERIPAKIVQFTGISQAMVETAPLAAEILPTFLPLLNSGILAAHNLEFDYGFLQTAFARLGLAFDRPEDQQLCTVQLSRLMLPDLPSRSLPDLVRHFQFNVGKSHRAAADTLACWLLAEQLLTEINAEEDQVLLARFARQWLPLKYAARLLGCSQAEGRSRLAEVASRFVGRGSSGTWMYRRGDVEKVFYEQQENQLSLL